MEEILSITDITEYLYCPRKFYLRKVKGIREFPSKQMILGGFKHKIFDTFNRSEQELVTSINKKIDEREISELYRKMSQKIISEFIFMKKEALAKLDILSFDFLKDMMLLLEKEIQLRVKSVNQGIKKGYLAQELWNERYPQYFSEVELVSSELGLKGRIDRLEIGENIIPYEIKTRENIFDADKLQLAGYSLLLEEEFDKDIDKGIIETSSKKEIIEINKELKDKFLELVNEIRDILNSEKELPIQNSFKKCEKCKLKSECFGE